MLNLLRATTLCLRAAGAADIKVEKQVAYHAAHALRVYLRVHLIGRVAALQQHRLGSDPARVISGKHIRIHRGIYSYWPVYQCRRVLRAPVMSFAEFAGYATLVPVQPIFVRLQGFVGPCYILVS